MVSTIIIIITDAVPWVSATYIEDFIPVSINGYITVTTMN